MVSDSRIIAEWVPLLSLPTLPNYSEHSVSSVLRDNVKTVPQTFTEHNYMQEIFTSVVNTETDDSS